MNRPKKNKIKNPTLPEDQQDVVDERNLIDVEESEEISFEDRVQMYWMENKGFVSGCILVLALGIIALNGMKMYKTSVEGKIQAAYAEAVANETLPDFAKSNTTQDLGGLAALTVADEAYTAEDFSLALEFYSIAADALSDNILEGRARLGKAFAQFYKGDKAGALSQLKEIADNNALPEAARAEAAYHLAIEADVSGQEADYDRYVAQIEGSSSATQWQQRLMMYQQQAR